MTVWIVGFVDSAEGLQIEAVLSSKEAAENLAKGYYGHRPVIAEWEVDS